MAGSPVMMSWVVTRGFATSYASAASATCWGCPATPRCAFAGVRWAWTATESPLAIGNGLAQVVRSDGLEAIHGARRGERSSGHRDGQVPGANAHRAQTDWTRGVAGDHPSSLDGRPHVGALCLLRWD